jgi:hypothetical protein
MVYESISRLTVQTGLKPTPSLRTPTKLAKNLRTRKPKPNTNWSHVYTQTWTLTTYTNKAGLRRIIYIYIYLQTGLAFGLKPTLSLRTLTKLAEHANQSLIQNGVTSILKPGLLPLTQIKLDLRSHRKTDKQDSRLDSNPHSHYVYTNKTG